MDNRKRYGDDSSLRRMHTENFSASRQRSSSQRRFWDTVLDTQNPSSSSMNPTTQYPRMDSASIHHYQSQSFHVPHPHHSPDVVRRKEFQCEICKVSFSQKSHLTQHIKTVHEKIRPYKCEHCSRAFGKRYDLISHIDAVHKKERPHGCLYCDKNFAKRSNLTRHIEHMHPDKHHHRKTAL